MANTNIQFYTDTRTVFETLNGNGKTAIGSADTTVQGLEIEYNLLTTPEAFKISPSGVNYTSGTTNNTTSLLRIAQVDSLIQSLETPPDATTIQVDKRILLTDGVSSGSIGISGTDTLIDATNNLVLDPVGGFVDLSGNTLDMGGGEIHQCPLLQGANNTNITVEGTGTGDVILKTDGVNRLDINETGAMTFDGSMTYNNATDTLTATIFDGLASNSTNSVNAGNLLVTTDDTSGNYYPTFVKTSGTDNKQFFIDTSSPMTYNPSTGVMAFPNPPTYDASATAINQLVNFNNFNNNRFNPRLVSSGGGGPAYSSSSTVGRFVRINNICIIQLEIRITGLGTLASGNLSIPLEVPNGSGVGASFSVGFASGLAGGQNNCVEVSAYAAPSATSITLGIRRQITNTGVTNLTTSDISGVFRIRVGGIYFV